MVFDYTRRFSSLRYKKSRERVLFPLMPKNATPEVIEKVKRALDETPRTINEIAERADTDWATTQRWLEILRSLGYVQEKKEGLRSLFFAQNFLSQKTLFDIPIGADDANIIRYIYATTRNLWKEKTGEYPSKSHVQKVLAHVNKEMKLSLPIGWYLYGEVCILPYDNELQYVYTDFENKKEVKMAIEQAVGELAPLKSTRKLRSYIYEKNHNDLYIYKEKVSYMRYGTLSPESLESLIHLLLEMIPHLPQNNRETAQLFTDYIGTLMDVKKCIIADTKMDTSKSMKIWSLIFDSFDILWSTVAIASFRNSLLKTGKFSTELLENRFKSRLSEQLDSLIMLVQQLGDIADIEKLYHVDVDKLTDDQKKLRALMGSARELTPEEKKEMDRKWNDPLERSKILREFGFD